MLPPATAPTERAYRVGSWLVDPGTNKVVNGDRLVRLEPKVMAVLGLLADHSGQTVTRRELLDQVWGGRFVEEPVLNRAVSHLRRVFDDDPRAPSYIETVTKVGYRLVAPIAPANPAASASLVAGARRASEPWVVSLLGAAIVVSVTVALVVRQPPMAPEPLPSRPITSFPGREFDPVVSSAGSIAFVRIDGGGASPQVYVLPHTGAEPAVVSRRGGAHANPAWSPLGDELAFRSMHAGTCRVVVISIFARAERDVTGCDPVVGEGLTWSADGQWLVFPDHVGSSSFGLVAVSLDGTERRTLTTAPDGFRDHGPVYAPDGSWVSFVRGRTRRTADLHVLETASGSLRRLTRDASFIVGHDWLGGAIVFSSNRTRVFRLWKLPLGGGEPTWFAEVGAYDPGNVSVMSDPAALVYDEWDFDFNLWRVDFVPHVGGEFTPVAASSKWDQMPVYSPDGRVVAFSSNRSGQSDIWQVEVSTGATRRLTDLDDRDAFHPSWSPDGEMLAFEVRSADGAWVYGLDLMDGTLTRLTSNELRAARPTWSADGLWVYFVTDSGEAWKVDRQGRALPVTVLETVSVRAVAEAPGSKYFYFTRVGEAGLWRLQLSGGSHERISVAIDLDDWGNWLVTDTSVAYVNRVAGSSRISMLDLRGGDTKHFSVGGAIPVGSNHFTLSPDGSHALITRTDRAESDIVFVDLSR